MSRRKKGDLIEDSVRFAVVLFVIGMMGFYLAYKDFFEKYGILILIVIFLLIIGGIVLIIYLSIKKKRRAMSFNDNKKILYMLKGMSPEEFEHEIANMFNRYGYKVKVVGKSHDGGIDVIAKRDQKKYLVQCKKYFSSKAGVVDVRSFYGVINKNNADGGFFITTNEFTREAKEEFKNDKKIRLIDKTELVPFYKKSLNK
ncbi:restriction endonuclease [bacterium]|nr:restriction endonuclease [bacterium]